MSCGLAAYTLQNLAVVGMMSVRPHHHSRHVGLCMQVDSLFPVYNISYVDLPLRHQRPWFGLPDRPDVVQGWLRPLEK